MKVEVKIEKPEVKFPCLMKDTTGMVVLMYQSKVGTVIANPTNSRKIGDRINDWNMNAFDILPEGEKVILSN